MNMETLLDNTNVMLKRTFFLIIIITWMGIIFLLSGEDSTVSGSRSKAVVQRAETAFYFIAGVPGLKHISAARKGLTQNEVRKAAHFLEYFLLGIMLILFLDSFRIKKPVLCLAALCICTLYAVTDEVHQIFVTGRGPGAADVLIDSAGAFAGIFMHLGATHLRKRLLAIKSQRG